MRTRKIGYDRILLTVGIAVVLAVALFAILRSSSHTTASVNPPATCIAPSVVNATNNQFCTCPYTELTLTPANSGSCQVTSCSPQGQKAHHLEARPMFCTCDEPGHTGVTFLPNNTTYCPNASGGYLNTTPVKPAVTCIAPSVLSATNNQFCTCPFTETTLSPQNSGMCQATLCSPQGQKAHQLATRPMYCTCDEVGHTGVTFLPSDAKNCPSSNPAGRASMTISSVNLSADFDTATITLFNDPGAATQVEYGIYKNGTKVGDGGTQQTGKKITITGFHSILDSKGGAGTYRIDFASCPVNTQSSGITADCGPVTTITVQYAPTCIAPAIANAADATSCTCPTNPPTIIKKGDGSCQVNSHAAAPSSYNGPIIYVAPQNTFYTPPLSCGEHSGIVTMSGDWVLTGPNLTLDQFVNTTENQLKDRLTNIMKRFPEVDPQTNAIIVIDIESPHPTNLYTYSLADQDRIIEAFKKRIAFIHTNFPNAKLGLYGTINPDPQGRAQQPDFVKQLAALVRAGQKGMYDQLDYLVPALYAHYGCSVSSSCESNWTTYEAFTDLGISASRQLKKSDGSAIAVLPYLSFRIYNGSSPFHKVPLLDLNVPDPIASTLGVQMAVLKKNHIDQVVLWKGTNDALLEDPNPNGRTVNDTICALMSTHAVCGNGKKEGAEQCDDGNTVDHDGCSAQCTIESTAGASISSSSSSTAPQYGLQKLASFKGIGSYMDAAIAPGRGICSGGSGNACMKDTDCAAGQSCQGNQRAYLSFQYYPLQFDLVALDPNNEYAPTVYTSPIPSEYAASAVTVGNDGNLYLGTKSTVASHIFKFDTSLAKLVDMGAVPKDTTGHTVTYLWQSTLSPYDHKIYYGAFPASDLVSFDPTTGHIANLGRMDPTNQYAHFVVADQNDPYIYVGIGSVSQSIIAYNIETGTRTMVASEPAPGFAKVWTRNGKTYGSMNKAAGGSAYYLLSNGAATLTGSVSYYTSPLAFSNGDVMSFNQLFFQNISIRHPNVGYKSYPFTYQGGPLDIFRVAQGPDNNIYAGTVLPFYLGKYDPKNSTGGLTTIAQLGGGEPYAMLANQGKLAIAAYANAGSPLTSYDPESPISPSPYYNPNCTAAGNNPQCTTKLMCSVDTQCPTGEQCVSGGCTPALACAVSGDCPSGQGCTALKKCAPPPPPHDWRPRPLVAAPDGTLYSGSIGGYGVLNGWLIKWNPAQNTYVSFSPSELSSLGVYSLAVASGCKNITNMQGYCLVGGTTINGGGGTSPTAATAPLFTWDPATGSIGDQFNIPNVPKVSTINDLIVNPKNGHIVGIAQGANPFGQYLFVFDPSTGTFIKGGTELRLAGDGTPGDVYNSVSIGSDGNIYGLYSAGIFMIDSADYNMKKITGFPFGEANGFSLVRDTVKGDVIYFSHGADLYSFRLPPASSPFSSTGSTR